jgi:hypothetical protein
MTQRPTSNGGGKGSSNGPADKAGGQLLLRVARHGKGIMGYRSTPSRLQRSPSRHNPVFPRMAAPRSARRMSPYPSWKAPGNGFPGQPVGAELVEAEHYGGVDGAGFDLPVGDRVQLQDAVLLGFVVGVGGLFPGFDHLKGDALLAEQKAQAFMADVIDHPLRDQEVGQLVSRLSHQDVNVVTST